MNSRTHGQALLRLTAQLAVVVALLCLAAANIYVRATWSEAEAGVLWTGSNNGVAYLSKDAGQHWQDVTPPGVGKFGDVNIQASHFSAGTAY